MKTTRDLKPGDFVYVTNPNLQRAIKCTVARVARKYFCLRNKRRGFDHETGSQPDNSGPSCQAYTEEQYALMTRAEAAAYTLGSLGVQFGYWVDGSLKIAVYDACVAAGLIGGAR